MRAFCCVMFVVLSLGLCSVQPVEHRDGDGWELVFEKPVGEHRRVAVWARPGPLELLPELRFHRTAATTRPVRPGGPPPRVVPPTKIWEIEVRLGSDGLSLPIYRALAQGWGDAADRTGYPVVHDLVWDVGGNLAMLLRASGLYLYVGSALGNGSSYVLPEDVVQDMSRGLQGPTPLERLRGDGAERSSVNLSLEGTVFNDDLEVVVRRTAGARSEVVARYRLPESPLRARELVRAPSRQ